MNTPAGFLAFQGANAVVSGKQFIQLTYSSDKNDKNALNMTNFDKCDE